MKRIFILTILIVGFSTIYSQKSKITSASASLANGKLDLAQKAIIEATKNEKSKNLPKTWKVYGDVFRNIFESPLSIYKELDEDPLPKALNAYKKALKLDEKAKYNKHIKESLIVLQEDFTKEAALHFEKKDFDKSLASFQNAQNINEIEIIKQEIKEKAIDTSLYYNTGLAAYNAKKMPLAIKYLTIASEYKYGGPATFLFLRDAYMENNDTLKALKSLQTAYKTFPDDNRIVIELINFYLQANKSDEALKYINEAITKDLENPSLYFVKGTLLEKSNDINNAIVEYHKALEIDSNYINAQYNIAVIELKKVEERQTEINDITNIEKYNSEFEKLIQKYINNVIPLFEKAHKMAPEETNIMEVLSSIYFKIRNYDDTMIGKYNMMKEKLEASKNK